MCLIAWNVSEFCKMFLSFVEMPKSFMEWKFCGNQSEKVGKGDESEKRGN